MGSTNTRNVKGGVQDENIAATLIHQGLGDQHLSQVLWCLLCVYKLQQ